MRRCVFHSKAPDDALRLPAPHRRHRAHAFGRLSRLGRRGELGRGRGESPASWSLVLMISMIIIGMITNHYDYWDDEWMMVIFFWRL